MSDDTRRKVLAAADDLGYLGDTRTHLSRQKMVALLVPGTAHRLLRGIMDVIGSDAMGQHHARILLSTTEAEPHRELAQLDEFSRDHRFEAVIVVGGAWATPRYVRGLGRIARRMQAQGQRLVMGGRALTAPTGLVTPGVEILEYDDVGGSDAAAELLFSKGHRTIGLIRGPVGYSISDARSLGVQRATERHGHPIVSGLIRSGSRGSTHGYNATMDLLTCRPETTAIFVESDMAAIGVLKAAHDLGRRVPQNLSVVGVEDFSTTEYLRPALTAVQMPFRDLGKRIIRRALGLEPTEREPGRFVIKTKLVERDSVASVDTDHLAQV